MRFDDLKKLLTFMDEHGLTEVEVRSWFTTLRLSRAPAPAAVAPAVAPQTSPAEKPQTADAGAEAEAPEPEKYLIIKSPMVGTFYRAPAPDAEPFVTEGSPVKRGQVLCIIEAMKIMNEIESEYAGVIAKVHVANGSPVEYGQPLFSIKPAATPG